MCWFKKRNDNQTIEVMKDILVLLINCHGSDTPGKRSPDGSFREYAWGREINKLILEELYKNGIKAVVVNPEEEEVSLKEICSRANNLYNKYKSEYKEIVIVSPHVNAGPTNDWSSASGFTVYVYNKASSKSRKLARLVADEAYDKYSLRGNRRLPESRVFEANFAVLRDTLAPAILSENLFMTNKKEVQFLSSVEGKEVIKRMHVDSILKYRDFYLGQ